jgi:hypothetical protein
MKPTKHELDFNHNLKWLKRNGHLSKKGINFANDYAKNLKLRA